MLLKQGADINYVNKKCESPFIYIVQQNDFLLFQKIFPLLSNVDKALSICNFYNRKAPSSNNLTIGPDLLKDFIDQFNINDITENMRQLLLAAAISFPAGLDIEFLQKLLTKNSNVNFNLIWMKVGNTVIITDNSEEDAAEKEKVKEHESKNNSARGEDQKLKISVSLLSLAQMAEKNDIVELLLRNGADVNVGFGCITPLYAAVDSGNYQITEQLLKRAADVNSLSGPNPLKREVTPLILAVVKGDLPMVEHLISAYQDPSEINYVSVEGSALYIAITYQHIPIVKTLVNAGADLLAKIPKKVTPGANKSYAELMFIVTYGFHNISRCALSTTFFYEPVFIYFLNVLEDKILNEDYLKPLKALPEKENCAELFVLRIIANLFMFGLLDLTTFKGQLEAFMKLREKVLTQKGIDLLHTITFTTMALLELNIEYSQMKSGIKDGFKNYPAKIRKQMLEKIGDVLTYDIESTSKIEDGIFWYLDCLYKSPDLEMSLFETMSFLIIIKQQGDNDLADLIIKRYPECHLQFDYCARQQEQDYEPHFQIRNLTGHSHLQSLGYSNNQIKALKQPAKDFSNTRTNNSLVSKFGLLSKDIRRQTDETSLFNGNLSETTLNVRKIESIVTTNYFLWIPYGLFDEQILNTFMKVRLTFDDHHIRKLEGKTLKSVTRQIVIKGETTVVFLRYELKSTSEERLLLYKYKNLLIALDYLSKGFHEKSALKYFLSKERKPINLDDYIISETHTSEI